MLTHALGGMLTPTLGGGCHKGYKGTELCSTSPPLQMRPDGDNQAAIDEVITHEEAAAFAADWPLGFPVVELSPAPEEEASCLLYFAAAQGLVGLTE